MRNVHWRGRCAALLVFSTVLVGCSNLDLASQPTTATPLSGVWLVDNAASDDVGSAMRPDKRLLGSRRLSTRAEIERLRRGSGLALVANEFQVLEADRIEIELGGDSMGVQHRPGVYRDVSWGVRARGIWQVQAGWQEDVLVVASKTNGISVTERYALVNRNRLLVALEIQADGNKRSILRAFKRLR